MATLFKFLEARSLFLAGQWFSGYTKRQQTCSSSVVLVGVFCLFVFCLNICLGFVMKK